MPRSPEGLLRVFKMASESCQLPTGKQEDSGDEVEKDQ